jgi:hypothetical protein
MVEDAAPLRDLHISSPPELSFVDQHILETPTKKHRKVDLLGALGLEEDHLSLRVTGGSETARGTPTRPRNLNQRLGDIAKMTDKNGEQALDELRAQVKEGAFGKVVGRGTTNCNEHGTGSQATLGPDTTPTHRTAARAAFDELGTIDPRDLYQQAALAQLRTDMALDFGAPEDGALVRSIASLSPHKPPQNNKKTRASSLASSPCKVAVKKSPRGGKGTLTPQKRKNPLDNDSAKSFNPEVMTTPPSTKKRFSRGANRNSKAWEPSEETAQECIDGFVVPELSRGSVISYGAGGRQIGKVRNGECSEERLLVAMRFVVV